MGGYGQKLLCVLLADHKLEEFRHISTPFFYYALWSTDEQLDLLFVD